MSFLNEILPEFEQMNLEDKAKFLGLNLKNFLVNVDFGRVSEDGERIFYFYPAKPLESVGLKPIIIGFYPDDFERKGYVARIGVYKSGLPSFDTDCYCTDEVVNFIKNNYIQN